MADKDISDENNKDNNVVPFSHVSEDDVHIATLERANEELIAANKQGQAEQWRLANLKAMAEMEAEEARARGKTAVEEERAKGKAAVEEAIAREKAAVDERASVSKKLKDVEDKLADEQHENEILGQKEEDLKEELSSTKNGKALYQSISLVMGTALVTLVIVLILDL